MKTSVRTQRALKNRAHQQRNNPTKAVAPTAADLKQIKSLLGIADKLIAEMS